MGSWLGKRMAALQGLARALDNECKRKRMGTGKSYIHPNLLWTLQYDAGPCQLARPFPSWAPGRARVPGASSARATGLWPAPAAQRLPECGQQDPAARAPQLAATCALKARRAWLPWDTGCRPCTAPLAGSHLSTASRSSSPEERHGNNRPPPAPPREMQFHYTTAQKPQSTGQARDTQALSSFQLKRTLCRSDHRRWPCAPPKKACSRPRCRSVTFSVARILPPRLPSRSPKRARQQSVLLSLRPALPKIPATIDISSPLVPRASLDRQMQPQTKLYAMPLAGVHREGTKCGVGLVLGDVDMPLRGRCGNGKAADVVALIGEYLAMQPIVRKMVLSAQSAVSGPNKASVERHLVTSGSVVDREEATLLVHDRPAAPTFSDRYLDHQFNQQGPRHQPIDLCVDQTLLDFVQTGLCCRVAAAAEEKLRCFVCRPPRATATPGGVERCIANAGKDAQHADVTRQLAARWSPQHVSAQPRNSTVGFCEEGARLPPTRSEEGAKGLHPRMEEGARDDNTPTQHAAPRAYPTSTSSYIVTRSLGLLVYSTLRERGAKPNAYSNASSSSSWAAMPSHNHNYEPRFIPSPEQPHPHSNIPTYLPSTTRVSETPPKPVVAQHMRAPRTTRQGRTRTCTTSHEIGAAPTPPTAALDPRDRRDISASPCDTADAVWKARWCRENARAWHGDEYVEVTLG
ncbi:hypothetical protein PSPO01_04941 [Paraphaeosphaeria sporulosa]